MKMKFKKIALYVAALFSGFLSYVGAVVIAAGLTNGAESSLIIAALPAVVIASYIGLKGGL